MAVVAFGVCVCILLSVLVICVIKCNASTEFLQAAAAAVVLRHAVDASVTQYALVALLSVLRLVCDARGDERQRGTATLSAPPPAAIAIA